MTMHFRHIPDKSFPPTLHSFVVFIRNFQLEYSCVVMRYSSVHSYISAKDSFEDNFLKLSMYMNILFISPIFHCQWNNLIPTSSLIFTQSLLNCPFYRSSVWYLECIISLIKASQNVTNITKFTWFSFSSWCGTYKLKALNGIFYWTYI